MFNGTRIKTAFLFLTVLFFSSSAFAERITITTYYPSPYGVYDELRANKMAVGTTYVNDPGTYPVTNNNLAVEGNIGIGNHNPTEKLHLAAGSMYIGMPSSGPASSFLKINQGSIESRSSVPGSTRKYEITKSGLVISSMATGTGYELIYDGPSYDLINKRSFSGTYHGAHSNASTGFEAIISEPSGRRHFSRLHPSDGLHLYTKGRTSTSYPVDESTFKPAELEMKLDNGTYTKMTGGHLTLRRESTSNSAQLVLHNEQESNTSGYATGIQFKLAALSGSSGQVNRKAEIKAVAAANWAEAVDLTFATGGSYPHRFGERMRINSNGLVGVGTNDPKTLLHVAGPNSATYYPALTIQNPHNSSTSTQYGVGIDFKLSSYSGTYEPSKKAQIRAVNGSTHANDVDLTFWSGGSTSADVAERMRIQHDGRVGIGTDAPARKLDVRGDMNVSGTVIDDEGNLILRNDRDITGTDRIVGYNDLRLWGDGGTGTPHVFIDGSGRVGIGRTPTSGSRLDVNGNIARNGGIIHSDKRFKKDIKILANSLEGLKRIKGVSFNWRTKEFPDRNFSGGIQYGVIAQNIEMTFPDLVTNNDDGYKAVNYEGLIPVLIEAVKEQQAQIEELKKQIEGLKK